MSYPEFLQELSSDLNIVVLLGRLDVLLQLAAVAAKLSLRYYILRKNKALRTPSILSLNLISLVLFGQDLKVIPQLWRSAVQKSMRNRLLKRLKPYLHLS